MVVYKCLYKTTTNPNIGDGFFMNFVWVSWVEIHHALLSQFSLLAEFLIGKVLVKQKHSRVVKLVNLNPGYYLI
jgi:hypothetical protein